MSDTTEQVSDNQIHDLIAWHERDGTKTGALIAAALRELLSARTSTAPVAAWEYEQGPDTLVPNRKAWTDSEEVAQAWARDPNGTVRPLYRSPQPGVLPTLTNEMARKIREAIDDYPYGPEVVDCRAEWIWRTLTASIPDSGEGTNG